MPVIVGFIPAMEKHLSKASKKMDRHLTSRMKEYAPTLRRAIEIALASFSEIISPPTYYLREELILDTITSQMEDWWNRWVPEAEDISWEAYEAARGIADNSFEKLFNIEYEEVPDEEIKVGVDPDSAGDLNPTTGELSRKEARSTNFPYLTVKVGSGGLSTEWERFLRAQFNAKVDPRNAITTFGAKDVARIKNEMIRGLRAGVDTTVVKKRLMNQLVRAGAPLEVRRQIAANVRRILRTTHQNATIASQFSYARTNPAVQGLIRQTGPRPCMACVSLAGKVYRLHQEFRDHPNGQCFVTYVMASPQALGFDVATMSPEVARAWRTGLTEVPSRRLQFLALEEAEQRAMFANDALFDFWQAEKFPLESLAIYKNGSYVQASYKDLITKIDTLGGISYPKSKFVSDAIKTQLLTVMDSYDRANSRLTVYLTKPTSKKNRYGKEKFPDALTADMLEGLTYQAQQLVDRIMLVYDSFSSVPWYAYNELARALNLGIRKSSIGSVYYVTP